MEYIIGSKVFGKWKIIGILGEGANGKVFEIEKTEFGVETRSALKVIRIPRSISDVKEALSEGMDEQSVTTYFQGFVDKLIKEVAVMASLKSHPNIVGYEDHEVLPQAGKIGWDILIRMELLTPLPDYLIKKPMAENDVLRLGIELAGALAYCQNKGIIHRDIKPQNVFVNELGQFKLGDFGVARTLDQTKSGLSRSGTEGYMAPEVYLNCPYGATVDVYSLGLMLYSLTNGNRLPFLPPAPQTIGYTEKMQALERRMKGEELPPPAHASEELAEVILKACAFASKERYRTAGELQEALRKVKKSLYAEEEDVSAFSESRQELQAEEPSKEIEESQVEEQVDKTVSAWSEPVMQKVHREALQQDEIDDSTVIVEDEPTSSVWKARPSSTATKKAESNQVEIGEENQKAAFPKVGILVGALVVVALLVMVYFNIHSWEPATCTSGSLCKICGQMKEDQLEHQWKEATCTTPRYCELCGKPDSVPMGHDTTEATCTLPRQCNVCGKELGKALGHQWIKQEDIKNKICSVCEEVKPLVFIKDENYGGYGYSTDEPEEPYYKSSDNCVQIKWEIIKKLGPGSVTIRDGYWQEVSSEKFIFDWSEDGVAVSPQDSLDIGWYSLEFVWDGYSLQCGILYGDDAEKYLSSQNIAFASKTYLRHVSSGAYLYVDDSQLIVGDRAVKIFLYQLEIVQTGNLFREASNENEDDYIICHSYVSVDGHRYLLQYHDKYLAAYADGSDLYLSEEITDECWWRRD